MDLFFFFKPGLSLIELLINLFFKKRKTFLVSFNIRLIFHFLSLSVSLCYSFSIYGVFIVIATRSCGFCSPQTRDGGLPQEIQRSSQIKSKWFVVDLATESRQVLTFPLSLSLLFSPPPSSSSSPSSLLLPLLHPPGSYPHDDAGHKKLLQ